MHAPPLLHRARAPRGASRPPLALAALAAACALVAVAAACGTLPSSGGDEDLPNAQAGPFRAIAQAELGNTRVAPLAMDDDARLTRDATVVDLDGDPSTLAAAGFFAASLAPDGGPADPLAPPNAIVRHDALDGRSFARAQTTVLQPDAPWEGGTVSAPSALVVGGAIWLYYAAAGGIGLARSADGTAFDREPSPVLAPVSSGWERGATPGSPGVVALPDGSFRMFYSVPGDGSASYIGEARSDDGVRWERVGARAVLAPDTAQREAAGEAYDSAAVFDPAPVLATSATGRQTLRVYYAAKDRAGRSVIALAARPLEGGALERADAPVFGASTELDPRAPCVAVYPGFSLLFATQRAGKSAAQAYAAVAAAVAPADAQLPPPDSP